MGGPAGLRPVARRLPDRLRLADVERRRPYAERGMADPLLCRARDPVSLLRAGGPATPGTLAAAAVGPLRALLHPGGAGRLLPDRDLGLQRDLHLLLPARPASLPQPLLHDRAVRAAAGLHRRAPLLVAGPPARARPGDTGRAALEPAHPAVPGRGHPGLRRPREDRDRLAQGRAAQDMDAGADMVALFRPVRAALDRARGTCAGHPAARRGRAAAALVADPSAGIPRLLCVSHRERASVQHRRLPLDDDRRHHDPVLSGMAVGARAAMRGRGDDGWACGGPLRPKGRPASGASLRARGRRKAGTRSGPCTRRRSRRLSSTPWSRSGCRSATASSRDMWGGPKRARNSPGA